MQRKVAGALVVAVLALVAGGCGEDSKPLTTAQLRTQANAVCQDVSREVSTLQANATQATMGRSLRDAADAMTDGIDRLEALTPPQQVADRYARFLAWMKTQRDAARQLATPGATLSARARRAIDPHVSPALTLAHELGFSSECA